MAYAIVLAIFNDPDNLKQLKNLLVFFVVIDVSVVVADYETTWVFYVRSSVVVTTLFFLCRRKEK